MCVYMVDKSNMVDKRRVALIENLNEISGWIDILARSCSTSEHTVETKVTTVDFK